MKTKPIMKYKTKQQILSERLPAIGNLSQWQKDMIDAMDEYALQEVNKISSKRDVSGQSEQVGCDNCVDYKQGSDPDKYCLVCNRMVEL